MTTIRRCIAATIGCLMVWSCVFFNFPTPIGVIVAGVGSFTACWNSGMLIAQGWKVLS
jgi:hypothetical protein